MIKGTKKLPIYLTILSLTGFLALTASAQTGLNLPLLKLPSITATPQAPNYTFLISWQASDFVPSMYEGRILPIKNSQVEIGFDLIDSDGKFVDVSKQKIQWNINHEPYQTSIGLKKIKFFVSNSDNDVVEILISNYTDSKYKTPSEISQFVVVSAFAPKAVIHTSDPYKALRVGDNRIAALPYFFNINSLNDLLFNWKVDGKKINNNLNLLSVNIPENKIINNYSGIDLYIQNANDNFEFAEKIFNFDIK
jgi:hypothetical protein